MFPNVLNMKLLILYMCIGVRCSRSRLSTCAPFSTKTRAISRKP